MKSENTRRLIFIIWIWNFDKNVEIFFDFFQAGLPEYRIDNVVVGKK